jgi:hypoxanthine phosphoribosyltransferase
MKHKCIDDYGITPLIHKDKISNRIKELASEIVLTTDGAVNIIPMMTGSLYFVADLTKELELIKPSNWYIYPVIVSSYKNETTNDIPKITTSDHFESTINKNNVTILIDDLADTGDSLLYLKEYLNNIINNKIKICVLVNKPYYRKNKIDINYKGFQYNDKNWLVGYGMDDMGLIRPAQCIGTIMPVGSGG